MDKKLHLHRTPIKHEKNDSSPDAYKINPRDEEKNKPIFFCEVVIGFYNVESCKKNQPYGGQSSYAALYILFFHMTTANPLSIAFFHRKIFFLSPINHITYA